MSHGRFSEMQQGLLAHTSLNTFMETHTFGTVASQTNESGSGTVISSLFVQELFPRQPEGCHPLH